MGGRGGSSGMVGGVTGYDYAQQLYDANKNSSIKAFRDELAFDLRYYKENGEIRDDYLMYDIIYKNGDHKTFGPYDSDSDIRSIKTSNISYISISSGDGFDDTLGFHSYTDVGGSIVNNPVKFEQYQAEVERLFGTDWGKKHPRRR